MRRNDEVEMRLKFKIGEIEFEAEGSADLIERERGIFFNTLLPFAVDAVLRTRKAENAAQIIAGTDELTSTAYSENRGMLDQDSKIPVSSEDLSRTSLSSFLTNYGKLSDQDFVLFAAYYDEKKSHSSSFTSENVKQYYSEARRQKYSNVSDLLQKLAQKGFIMDDDNAEKKIPKAYMLTNKGLEYIENYQPKENGEEKSKSPRPKKTHNKKSSVYASICADDLNLKNYPEIKIQDTFKKQMLLTLYIMAQEGKGESFSIADIQYLMTDMLGLPTSSDQISGVFKRNKSWFKSEPDPDNKKAYKWKLLQGAKDFVETILNGY